MKTLHLSVGTVEVPLRRPFRTALRSTSAVRSVVLRLDTDASTGWGAASPTVAVSGDTEEGIVRDALLASARLDGATWDHPAEVLAGLGCESASGLAAVEMALHDAWARSLGQPLWQLLGGSRPALLTDLTVSVDDPSAMAAAAEAAVAAGFFVLKVKVGADPENDQTRVEAVAAAAPGATLRIDANQGWSADEAFRIVTALEEAGLPLDLVEQPVPAHDLAGLAAVRSAIRTPVLADEAVFSPTDARRVLELGAADLLNVKLLKAGGIAPALEIAQVAEEAGVGCMIGAMMESTVGIAAAAAVACGRSPFERADLDPPLLAAAEPVVGGLVVEGPALAPADAPGLGIDDVLGVSWIS